MSTRSVTTMLAAAQSYGLTTLATVKAELSIKDTDTSNDVWLTRAIGQISKTIMNATNRVFAPEFIMDQFDIGHSRSQVPQGAWEIILSRYPVLAITSVVQLPYGNGVLRTLLEGVDFQVDYQSGEMYRLNASNGRPSAWEPFPLAVKYAAGYGEIASAIDSVPAVAPFSITVNDAASFSSDVSVAYASGVPLTRVVANPAAGQYIVSAGVYTFAPADAGQALDFVYTAIVLPDDLEEVCLRLVTGRFRSRDRDPALIQRDTHGIGTERFWFGGAPGQSGQFPPDIEAILDQYNVPVAA